MMRLSRPRLSFVVVGALVLSLQACGSGGGSDSATKTDATTTTKPAVTTTTAPAIADADTIALAKASVYPASEFPKTWAEAVPARDFVKQPWRIDPCLNPKGGEKAALAQGALSGGPSMKNAAGTVFIGTYSMVFPTKEAADAWSTRVATKEFQECERVGFEKRNAPKTGKLVLEPNDSAEQLALVGKNGLVRSQSWLLKVDGKLSSGLTLSSYQVGRVIFDVQIDNTVWDKAFDDGLTLEATLRGAVFDRARSLQGLGGGTGG